VLLHVVQPAARGWHRQAELWGTLRRPPREPERASGPRPKRVARGTWDLYWSSDDGVGRERLLQELVAVTRDSGLARNMADEWSEHDVELPVDRWHGVRIRTATEELGGPRRFTRMRFSLVPSFWRRFALVAVAAWCVTATLAFEPWAMALGGVLAGGMLLGLLLSRRVCRARVASLGARAAAGAGLTAVDHGGARPASVAETGEAAAGVSTAGATR